VLVTTAVPSGGGSAPAGAPDPSLTYDWVVLAYGRTDGSVRWRRTLHTGKPHEGTHRDGTFASGSAITDGSRVYAFFGSRGVYALDMSGTVLWEKQLGRMQTRMGFGEGASPALHGGTLVVNWDHEGDDFIVALDSATGRERWRQSRDEPTTWGTPHVAVHAGRAQVVVPGTNSLSSYDLDTGKPVWQAPGLTMNVIPSPVSADGIVYATSGFRGNALRAVRLSEASGEVSDGSGLAWTYDRDTPYVPSPLLYRGGLYFLKSNSGILTQLDAKTGEPRFSQQRLEAVPNVYASPVAADGRVYIVGTRGDDGRARGWPHAAGAGDQRAAGSLRRLARARRGRDVSAGAGASLSHLGVGRAEDGSPRRGHSGCGRELTRGTDAPVWN
jgi:outer membrane protein assembly factor BamB